MNATVDTAETHTAAADFTLEAVSDLDLATSEHAQALNCSAHGGCFGCL
ncbi:hypothetical protein [Rhizohabitans arisaemae]|nr:hypothetical protein [Rhizohabitans arisaemae]